MNRFLVCMIALIGCFAPDVARAQVFGKPVPEFELQEERDGKKKHYDFKDLYRGRVALCYFWRTSSIECIDGFKMLTDLQKKYKSKGLRLVSFCADSKERYEKAVKELSPDLVFTDRFFGTGALLVQERYFGAMSQPEVVLLDPRGYIVWRGTLRDGLEEAIKEVIEYSKPAAGNEAELRRRFSMAEKFESQREFGKAYTAAENLKKITDGDSNMQEKARSLMEKLAESGSKWLKEALDAEKADDIEKAARIVAEVSVRFGAKDEEGKTRDVARDADNEIGRMNGDRKFKEPIRDAIENAKAEVLMDAAAELEFQGWYDDAVETYTRVTEDFKPTKAAKAAKEAVERIQNDKTIQAKIADMRLDDSAHRWYFLGKWYTNAQMIPQAREQYERILKDAPKSAVVPKAKEALGKLPKDSAAAGGAEAVTAGKKPDAKP